MGRPDGETTAPARGGGKGGGAERARGRAGAGGRGGRSDAVGKGIEGAEGSGAGGGGGRGGGGGKASLWFGDRLATASGSKVKATISATALASAAQEGASRSRSPIDPPMSVVRWTRRPPSRACDTAASARRCRGLEGSGGPPRSLSISSETSRCDGQPAGAVQRSAIGAAASSAAGAARARQRTASPTAPQIGFDNGTRPMRPHP